MQLQGEERSVVADIAQQAGVPVWVLMDAVEHESVTELAQVLGISQAEAARRFDPVRRTVTVGDDWGAGCKLLTDELRAELRAALGGLLRAADHSASPDVSHG